MKKGDRRLAADQRSDYYVITSGARGHTATGRGQTMRAKLVQIGNSRGVRLPKAMIEEVGLGDELEISVRKGEIVIARVKGVREGWAEDARHMKLHEKPFPAPPPTHFMLYEHEWPMEDFGIADE